jgi:hypothetical protein
MDLEEFKERVKQILNKDKITLTQEFLDRGGFSNPQFIEHRYGEGNWIQFDVRIRDKDYLIRIDLTRTYFSELIDALTQRREYRLCCMPSLAEYFTILRSGDIHLLLTFLLEIIRQNLDGELDLEIIRQNLDGELD